MSPLFPRKEKDSSKKASVREIQFSGPTYLVEVQEKDTKNLFWPFFQFAENGKPKDAFCSCDQKDQVCIHLAAAYDKILGNTNRPLHERFSNSFWNHLCFQVGERMGFEFPFTRKKNLFFIEGNVSIRALTPSAKKKLIELIEQRTRETPDTSIKFSNLPPEEITRWKEGRPSPALRYELSFWSDLAKWMMLLQEEGVPYHIETETRQLPLTWSIRWDRFVLEVNLSRENLIPLIPFLETVRFPLRVYHSGVEQIHRIVYDPRECIFFIQRGLKKAFQKESVVSLNGWSFVPGEGFYSENGDSLLSQPCIKKEKISEALTIHGETISQFLEGTSIHKFPCPMHYSMYFDGKWHWHFSGYLDSPGDLHRPLSAFFGDWAYLHEKGFYPLQDSLFPTLDAVVLPHQVSRFVHQNRIWLNGQKGFETHLAGIESHLTFAVTEAALVFQSSEYEDKSLKNKGFGDWIYFQSLGFFSKRTARLETVVRPGTRILLSEISTFIHSNREELESIPGFFLFENPLATCSLKIDFPSDTSLMLIPTFEPSPPYQTYPMHFFGDFIYVKSKGFFELPLHMRLPDLYQAPCRVDEKELHDFFSHDWPSLKKFVEPLDPRIQDPHLQKFEINSLSRLPEGGLELSLAFVSEIGSCPVFRMIEALQNKKRYLFSPAGRIDLKDERYAWLDEVKDYYHPQSKTFLMPALAFFRLDAREILYLPETETPKSEEARRLLFQLRSFAYEETPDLTGLKSTLRTYQKTGLQWLWFLYVNGLSGLLCDEMGLGKTHQAMALIAAIQNQGHAPLFFVVCPTSVIYHWQDKLKSFLPGVRVHLFHGQNRLIPKKGLILTSYGMLRSEREQLKQCSFSLAVFDEIQIAKNPQSKIHQVLVQIQARMRVGLTGTPIENNLRELKALFDIVLPGYMPSDKRYREFFMVPIERDGDEEKKSLLTHLIRPFVLRRRKKEVLQELPEKSEEKAYCTLSAEQEELYQSVLKQHREALVAELRRESKIPYIHIFSLLATLKQICNHPALFHKNMDQYGHYQSGKWDLFVELLEEARDSEQKVVVFSQYLGMLDIIELHLQQQGWGYAQIRGSTMDRREQVRRFQEDRDCFVFIGSLQAAGLGIDLTAASSVFLYDRWWNAARENQAIDRVHRIGQKWGVQVFKFITKDTIEEKIDHMILKKGALMEDVILADDQSALKTFSREELIDLLTYRPHGSA